MSVIICRVMKSHQTVLSAASCQFFPNPIFCASLYHTKMTLSPVYDVFVVLCMIYQCLINFYTELHLHNSCSKFQAILLIRYTLRTLWGHIFHCVAPRGVTSPNELRNSNAEVQWSVVLAVERYVDASMSCRFSFFCQCPFCLSFSAPFLIPFCFRFSNEF